MDIGNYLSSSAYNEEEVYYCPTCLSLSIRGFGDVNYCDECGTSAIVKTDIHTWEKMYEDKYGKKFINKK